MHAAGGRTAVIFWPRKSEKWSYQGSMATEESRESLEGTEPERWSHILSWSPGLCIHGIDSKQLSQRQKTWDGLPPKEQSLHFQSILRQLPAEVEEATLIRENDRFCRVQLKITPYMKGVGKMEHIFRRKENRLWNGLTVGTSQPQFWNGYHSFPQRRKAKYSHMNENIGNDCREILTIWYKELRGNSRTKIKILLDGFNSWMEMISERFSELEDKIREFV